VILQDAAPEGLVAFVTSLESRLAILLEAKVRSKVTEISISLLNLVDRKGAHLSHFPNAHSIAYFSMR